MTPEEVVRAFIEAYNKCDVDGMTTYLADDFVRFSNTSKTWRPMNKEEWKDMAVRFYAAFPDERWEVLSMVAEGDTVAIEVIETATFTKPWVMPDVTIQPTGKTYSSRNSLFFQVNRDGLIQNYRQYASTAFLEVGIKPKDIKSTY
jgi:steroid delta-isomerase-like uncharacterized protein